MKNLLNLFLILSLTILASCGGGGGGGSSSGGDSPTPTTPTIPNINYSYFTPKNTDLSMILGDANTQLVSISTQGNKGVASLNGNRLIYSPNNNVTGDDKVVINASRISGNITLTVNITITATNTKPVANNLELFVQRGNGITFTLPVSDPDGDSLTYEYLSIPNYGNLVMKPSSSPNWAYDAPNAEIQVSFSYRVFDGQLYSEPALVTINVTRPNVAPTFPGDFLSTFIVSGKAQINEDSSLNYSFTMVDADNTSLIGLVTVQGIHGEATLINNGNKNFTLNYLPELNYFGEDSISIKFDDGLGGIAERVIPIKILPVNDAPEVAITSASVILDKNEILGELLDLGVVDVDSSNLTLLLDTPSTLVNFEIKPSKKIFILPKFNAEGQETVVIRVSDGVLTSQPITVQIKVNGDPLPPIQPVNDEYSFDQGTSLAFTLKASNVLGRNISFQIITYPEGGSSAISGTLPNITYTPPTNFSGSTLLAYTIYNEDDDVVSDTGIILIDVVRTNFSNVWTLDRFGELFEGDRELSDGRYVLDSKFFISPKDEMAVFSIFTNNMSCQPYSDTFIWLNLTGKNSVENLDLQHDWTCFDGHYLLSNRSKSTSTVEVKESLIKSNIFENFFVGTSAFRFEEVQSVPECSSFSSISDLKFLAGNGSSGQEDCYISLANQLIQRTDIEKYYPINDKTLISEGVHTLVNKFLEYTEVRDNSVTYLNKEAFIKEVNDKLGFYTGGKFGFILAFPACSAISPFEYEDLLNPTKTVEQQNCIKEIFDFYDQNYPEFYFKTGYLEPSNKIGYNIEIENIVEDILVILLDPEFSDFQFGSCKPESSILKTYLFAESFTPTLKEFIETEIPECSVDYLSTIPGYNPELSIDYVINEFDPSEPEYQVQLAIKNCHMEILDRFSDKISAVLTSSKRSQSSSYDDLLNKANISMVLETMNAYDSGVCVDNFAPTAITEYIYQNDKVALYKNNGAIQTEVHLGYKKTSDNENTVIDYSSSYSSFVGTNISRVSLLSSENETLSGSVLALNQQLAENNSYADFVKIPNKLINGSEVFVKIKTESNENILAGIYQLVSGKMEMISEKEEYVGKMFQITSGTPKLIISTYNEITGYYLYEIQ